MEGLKTAWAAVMAVPEDLKNNWPAIVSLGLLDFAYMYVHDAAPAGDTLFQSRLMMASVNGFADASKYAAYNAIANGSASY